MSLRNEAAAKVRMVLFVSGDAAGSGGGALEGRGLFVFTGQRL
jgi:hypothetical protein